MAALDFPNAPTDGQLFSGANGVVYQWNAAKTLWLAYPGTPAVSAPTYDSRSDASVSLTGTIPMDDTIPQITEGNRLFQRSYTAVDPTRSIEVSVDANFGNGSAGLNYVLALFIDNAPDAITTRVCVNNVAQTLGFLTLRWRGVLSAGPHTFEIRCGSAYLARNDTQRFFGGSIQSTMVIQEIGVGVQGPPGPLGSAATQPALQVFAAAGGIATSPTYTKVVMAGATVDVGNYWNGANNRWIPPAGTYVLTGAVSLQSATGTIGLRAWLYKNGVGYANGMDTPVGAGGVGTANVTGVVQANGTDYFELWGSADAAGNSFYTPGTYLSGYGLKT